MNFTTEWFDRHMPLFEKHLSHLKGVPNLNFLEIGSFEGKSSCWLLDNVLTDPSCHLFCADTFEGSPEHDPMRVDYTKIYDTFMENVRSHGNKVVVLKGISQDMIRDLPLRYYDFVYIDGSHYGSDVLEDAVISWRLLKSGGIMAFDDYFWSFWTNRFGEDGKVVDEDDYLKEPKIAIDAFINIFRGQYEALTMQDQVWIKKI